MSDYVYQDRKEQGDRWMEKFESRLDKEVSGRNGYIAGSGAYNKRILNLNTDLGVKRQPRSGIKS